MRGVLSEECVEYIEQDSRRWCIKLIRLRAGNASLYVELVKRNPNGKEVAEVLAELPREIYFVDEPYFGGHFVAYEGSKLVLASRSWSDFLRSLRKLGYYVSYSRYLQNPWFLVSRVEKTISVGLSDSGDVVDPFGVLDATDYGAEPLKATYAWVKSMYTGRNAVYAWFNVIALVTLVAVSPLKKYHPFKKHYLDYVVYNVGVSGFNLAMYVLEPMLGGHRANDAYDTVLYGAPLLAKRGSKLLAVQLLNINRLPLVLVGQTKKTLEVYRYLLESTNGAVELGRRKVEVPNLRSLFVFTMDALSRVHAERGIMLRWEPRQIRTPPPAGLPRVKPIYGFAARLWKKYRNRLAGPNKLLYLVDVAAEVIAQEIRNEAEEVATFTEQVATEIKSCIRSRNQNQFCRVIE